MPYRDPEKQCAYMKTWRAANTQRVGGYRRAAVLDSALSKHRFPSLRSIERHRLTEEELMRIVAGVVAAQRS